MLIFGILLLPEDVFCNQRLREHIRGENDKIPYFLDDVGNTGNTHKPPVLDFQDKTLHTAAFCVLCLTWHVYIDKSMTTLDNQQR
jgi:hypothetical protein